MSLQIHVIFQITKKDLDIHLKQYCLYINEYEMLGNDK